MGSNDVVDLLSCSIDTFRLCDLQSTGSSEARKLRPATFSSEAFPISSALMTNRSVVLVALLLAAAAPSTEAQRSRGSRPIELGIDGGVTFGLDAPRVHVVALPIQNFRIGFPITNKIALEPSFHLNSIHGQGGGSLTTYAFEVGLVYSPDGDRVGKGFYGRPFLGVAGVNVSGAGDDNNGYAGIGAGLKLPFDDRRLATRLETNYSHGFGNGGSNQIGLLIGLSFFTR